MIGQSFTNAWEVFKNDMGSWVVFFMVFAILATVAGSIIPLAGGLAMLPLAIRETSKAVQEQRSPNVPALWDFSNLGGDLITMLMYAAAQLVGMMMCFVGWPFAWIGFWYTAELAADAKVSPSDAFKLSWAWSKRNLGDTIGMAFLSWCLSTIGASVGLGFGLLLTGPMVLIAWAMYWHAVRDQVYALAVEQGIEVKKEAPPQLVTVEQPADIDLTPEGELAHFQEKLDGSL